MVRQELRQELRQEVRRELREFQDLRGLHRQGQGQSSRSEERVCVISVVYREIN